MHQQLTHSGFCVDMFVTQSGQCSQPVSNSRTITHMAVYKTKHMLTLEVLVWSEDNTVNFVDLICDNGLL